jgi:hypothetical protein
LSARAPAHATHKRGHFVSSLKFSACRYNHLSDTLNSADLSRLSPLPLLHMRFGVADANVLSQRLDREKDLAVTLGQGPVAP